MACETYPDGSSAVKNRIRQGRRDRLGTQRHEILGWPQARADPTSGTQRLVLYLVSTTPSGNVRASTRLRFTQLSRAVKNGVRSEEHTSELQSHSDLVCRLLLEKKKKHHRNTFG